MRDAATFDRDTAHYFAAKNGYIIQRDGDWVTLRRKDSPQVVEIPASNVTHLQREDAEKPDPFVVASLVAPEVDAARRGPGRPKKEEPHV